MRRLILRPGGIGDSILSFPALEHLSVSHVTEIWVRSVILPLIGFGDSVWDLASTSLNLMGVGDLPTDPGLASRLQSFDHIVSWYGAARPDFRAAMKALGVPCDFHAALPPAGYRGHAADFFAQQVGAPSGQSPRIDVGVPIRRDSVVIQPFSGSIRKNWPLSLFRELASNLPACVEWCAGPEETLPSAHRFENLADLARWIAGTRLYIGNDSGITHLASAVGVPVLAIFLTTDPAMWAPCGEHITVLENPTLQEALETANRLLG